MTERPFTFEACPDAEACRSGIRPLLAPGMTWSEIHCGRCGQAGIVVHADLDPVTAPAIEAAPAPEPAPEHEADQADEPARKGGRS
ncbi:hypothetical protein [Methylobacterium sp. WL7]|uniref:hypothetical protein n=1 Tax=Methylobacterium sp. WL7 TaxID=2603900 RepID=UPI0011CB25BC|nr:hypothetical protein [Methylobacterium sp. WL7]TXN47364.1 hypothetical protein FV233_04870 [Methylobacterium sp. WL7]